MSAYQVDTDMIDLIVSAGIMYDFTGERRPVVLSAHFRNDVTIYTDAARECVRVLGEGSGGMLSVFECDSTGPRYWSVTDIGTMIGRELVAANVASVAARYPRDTFADRVGGMVTYLPDDYAFRPVSRSRFADYAHVFGALACFEYQSCETGEDTLADRIVDGVRRVVAMRVADAGGASWSWSRDYVADRERELRASFVAGSAVIS